MNSYFIQKMNLRAVRMLTRQYCHLKDNPVGECKKYKIKRLENDDPMFSKIMLSVKSRKAREKSGFIALEGRRLIEDAFRAGVKIKMIFYTKREYLNDLSYLDENTKLYKMPYKDMQLWSDLTTAPGIVAFCRKPEKIETSTELTIPVTVVCDQVREPGNLGAIIRCAAGAGVQKVVLTKGCVDLWGSKVLRGAAGAHFRIPVINDVTWEEFPKHIGPESNFLLTVHQPASFGSSLPCYPYYTIDYKSANNTVVVVGGETEGLSEDILLKAKEFNGKAINIPLSNNVESLNCVSALSIVLFEIKRQLCCNF